MQAVNRVFNLRPGDFSRGVPVFTYYLLIITFYMMGRVARDAIFLDHYKAVQLPYADMSVAFSAMFLVALYIRAGRVFSLPNLQTGSLLFFSLNLVGFWWGLHVQHWGWLAPVFYVWLGICGILSVTQVWTLANFLWTTREAKRLFGLLGSGGILGGIAGGFLAKAIALRLGTEAMLLVMTALLLACAALVPIIWKQQAEEHTEQADANHGRPKTLVESFRLVSRSPHLRAIAALILLSSVVTTAAGWQLKAIAKDTIGQKDALAAFLGAFAGYTGVASLIAQLLITTKLLRRFGIGVALLVLPVSLIGGSLAVLAWGNIWAASILKGSDGVFRYSVDTSAVQLLYLPVPANIKLEVKSFIDTVIWKAGDGLAALTLLLFATMLHFTPRQISVVNLGLLAVWVIAAMLARRHYVATLRENIQHVGLRPDEISVPTLDHSTSNIVAEKLNSADPNEILYALDLFEMGQQAYVHSGIKRLLEHPSAHIRKKAISVLSNSADRSVQLEVSALLHDENLEVRTEALRYLTWHDHIDPASKIEKAGDFEDFAVCSATVAFLARSGEPQNVDTARIIMDKMIEETGDQSRQLRLEAARLLASLPGYFEKQLEMLLQDPDAEVRCGAIQAAGSLREDAYVPDLLRALKDPETADDAVEALALFGDAVVPPLLLQLGDKAVPKDIREKIPQVLARIGTGAAANALTENLVQADTEVRFRTISALNKMQELRRNLTLDRDVIETVMIAELTGHYRSYQILGAQGGVPDDDLRTSMAAELERIFRLMKLLFPSIDLKNAYNSIQSRDPVRHSNALEFLDTTLNSRLRTLLLPLLDSEVSVAERIRLADRFLGFSVEA
jgi:AAA family ATP:ADP antiporter